MTSPAGSATMPIMQRDALAVVPETALPPAPRSRANAFRALHSIPFRWYFAGQIVSASGSFVQQTAVAWLVLQVTGSPASLGLVLAVGGLPSLLLGPWGGLIADRVDLRRLLIVTQAIFAALAGLLWLLAANGHAGVPLIVAIQVVGGVVSIVDSPARQSFVSDLVPPQDLASALSLNGVVFNSARVIGPALAGIVIVTIGTTPCFAVNAVSYLAVMGALFVIRPVRSGRRVTTAGGGGVRDALVYARGRQQLWLPLVMMGLVGLLAFNFTVVLPVFARDDFDGSGGTYGLLSTMLSIGSVAGSLGVGLIRHPRRRYLVGTSLAFGLCLAATAAAPTVLIASITLVLTGVAAFSFTTLASTTLQLHSAPAYRGRILALWVFVYIGTTPIGSVVTGWLIDAAGARAALLVGSGACLLAAGIAFRVQTPPNPDAQLSDLAGQSAG
jgi:MFS family permease